MYAFQRVKPEADDKSSPILSPLFDMRAPISTGVLLFVWGISILNIHILAQLVLMLAFVIVTKKEALIEPPNPPPTFDLHGPKLIQVLLIG